MLICALQAFLIELNSHGYNSLLQMTTVGVEEPVILYMGEMSERCRNVAFQLYLYALDFPFVDLLLLQVVLL